MAGLTNGITPLNWNMLVFLALLWGLWCLGHSLLISARIQERFRQRWARQFRFYRLCYNGFALISLIPVLGYSHTLKTALLFSWQGMGMILWALLWGVVIFLGVQGAKAYDMGYVSGLRQALEPEPDKEPFLPLSRSGILSVVRHPWYLAALILFWIRSREIFVSTLVENLVLTLYIFIGIRLEEQKLIQAYGNTYRSYQKRVPALLPWGKIFSALARRH